MALLTEALNMDHYFGVAHSTDNNRPRNGETDNLSARQEERSSASQDTALMDGRRRCGWCTGTEFGTLGADSIRAIFYDARSAVIHCLVNLGVVKGGQLGHRPDGRGARVPHGVRAGPGGGARCVPACDFGANIMP